MLDPDASPRDPRIAAAIGPVRAAIGAAGRDGAGSRLLVAVSGGRDSVAALGLLVVLARSERLQLSVGHVDHGLRPESRRESERVAELAQALRLPQHCTRVSLTPGAGLPARARAARRAALLEQAQACGATAIVLAHTATDQAETMLMHMFRGAGLDGLAAMQPWEAPLLRPLLTLTRAQTGGLCQALDLPHVDDPTNLALEAERIWLREVVFPRARERHPQLEQGLGGLARQARDADHALLAWAAREVGARQREAGCSWSLAGFDQLPRAVRTRALRMMCEQSGVDLSQLRRRVIETMDRAAVAASTAPRPGPRRFDLHPGCRIMIDKNGLHGPSDPPQGQDRNL